MKIDIEDTVNSLRNRVDMWDSARARAEIREGMPRLSRSENPVRVRTVASRGKRYLPGTFFMAAFTGVAVVWDSRKAPTGLTLVGAEISLDFFLEAWREIQYHNQRGVDARFAVAAARQILTPSADRFSRTVAVTKARRRDLSVMHRVAELYPMMRKSRSVAEIDLYEGYDSPEGGQIRIGGSPHHMDEERARTMILRALKDIDAS